MGSEVDLAAVRRWWPLAAVLALLFVTSLAATRSKPQLDDLYQEPEVVAASEVPQPSVSASVAPERPKAASGLPDWVGMVAMVTLAVVALAFVVFLISALVRDQVKRRARRAGRGLGRKGRRRPGDTTDDLVAALDAGLEELSDADRDPRRAVIACWVRLEQAAAAAGTPRHPGDSPTDLVGRLLAEQQVDARVLAALLEVYRQARYATHTVDDQMRRQAREALQRLRADLGAGVPA